MCTYLKSGLLVLTKGVLTDKLHDFNQIIFFLKDVLESTLVSHEVWVSSVVVLGKGSIVVGERDVPVDGWEMLSLGELLVQTPEDLYDIKSSCCNWVREVTTWWGYGTDDGNRSLSVGGTEAHDLTGSFVELSQLGTQVSWET